MFDKFGILHEHLEFLKSKIGFDDIFIVGGSVRDILMGITDSPKDIDITCACEPDDLRSSMDKTDISIFRTEKFGTITFLPKKGEFKKIKYEITPFREEGKYDDFRHPGEIKRTKDLISDSRRRDFSINCIYFSGACIDTKIGDISLIDKEKLLKTLSKDGYIFLADTNTLILQNQDVVQSLYKEGKQNLENLKGLLKNPFGFSEKPCKSGKLTILIDLWGGINDIINPLIKCVGNPDDRFGEDALRIIRALRFVNILNQKLKKKKIENYFNIQNETWESMKKNSQLVQHVAKERIREEVLKVFVMDNPFGFVSLLVKLDLLKYLFPSIDLTRKVDQPIRYHPFDVFEHTLLSLRAIQGINKDYLVKLGILYHDVGKPIQYAQITDDMTKEEIRQINGSELHHPNIGENITLKELKELGYSKKEAETVTFYVKQHMLIGEILKSNPENLEKKVKRLLSDFGYRMVNNLIDITIADRIGQFNPVQPMSIKDLKDLKILLKKIYKEQGAFGIKDLAIDGNDLINELNISPSPEIGNMLKASLERVLEDVAERNQKQKILEFLKDGFQKI